MNSRHDIRPGRLSKDLLAKNFDDLVPVLTDHQAMVESGRCLFCHDAPCIEACPTGIDIPAFIRKIMTGNAWGAAMDILDENIMGGTCANVCPVEDLCERSCVRNLAEDRPVSIGRLQRFATDHLMATGSQPFQRAEDSGHRVAVVGAGPAGLACAHRLSMHGHQITVFESREKPGGLNEYGIAAYKMANERAAREVAMIVGLGGIEIKTGSCLGLDVTLQQLRKEFDAVFLGVGLGDVNRLGVENEDIPGMYDAVDFIARIRQEPLDELEVGRRVVVIGGGSTAIDIAIQCRKLGSEEVTMVYRRGEDDMSATGHEQQLARDFGVVIRTEARPIRIESDLNGLTGVEFESTRTDGDRRAGAQGERFLIVADMAFKAIGQRLDPAPLTDQNDDLKLVDGKVAVDAFHHTSLGFVYAGGDCVSGKDLTVQAVQDGKLAAETIHSVLMGEGHG